MRSGIGYDVHAFKEDRALILGGVKIPYEKGLDGHSDADVLIHAVMDALLGAAALGDIGNHFPDTDINYKDISSIKLLEHVKNLIEEADYTISNIDSTVIAQEPKLSPYTYDMRANIAKALNIDINKISVKATTEEYLGFTGEMLGIKAVAIATLRSFV